MKKLILLLFVILSPCLPAMAYQDGGNLSQRDRMAFELLCGEMGRQSSGSAMLAMGDATNDFRQCQKIADSVLREIEKQKMDSK